MLAASCTVALAMLAVTSSAFAVAHHPKGEFAPFADCPLSNPSTEACILAKTESGEFVVGKEKVPIVNTITLQGGIHENEGGTTTFIGAEDGTPCPKHHRKCPAASPASSSAMKSVISSRELRVKSCLKMASPA